MLSSVLNVGLFLAIVLLLAVNIGNVAYLFGVLVSFVSQVFNLFSYVGASCDTITTVSGLLTGSIIFVLIVKLISHLLNNK